MKPGLINRVSYLYSMNKQQNLSLISDLISLAKADDKITNSEYDFIIRLAHAMDIHTDEVFDLFRNPLPSKPLPSELERIAHFYKLILVMNVDREIHEKEVIAMKNFGLKMGIRPGVIDQILLQMDKFEDRIIPSDVLLKIFQTYYN